MLASWSDRLLLPKRGILIDDKEYNGKRMMTNNYLKNNSALAYEFQSTLFTLATIVDGGLWDQKASGDCANQSAVIFNSFSKKKLKNKVSFVPNETLLFPYKLIEKEHVFTGICG